MIFKDFEFRATKTKDRYELVKWQPSHDFDYMPQKICFVVAYIEYNPKELDWEFESCGLRYLQCYEDGLNEFVLKYVELLNLRKKYHDNETEEFYAHC